MARLFSGIRLREKKKKMREGEQASKQACGWCARSDAFLGGSKSSGVMSRRVPLCRQVIAEKVPK